MEPKSDTNPEPSKTELKKHINQPQPKMRSFTNPTTPDKVIITPEVAKNIYNIDVATEEKLEIRRVRRSNDCKWSFAIENFDEWSKDQKWETYYE